MLFSGLPGVRAVMKHPGRALLGAGFVVGCLSTPFALAPVNSQFYKHFHVVREIEDGRMGLSAFAVWADAKIDVAVSHFKSATFPHDFEVSPPPARLGDAPARAPDQAINLDDPLANRPRDGLADEAATPPVDPSTLLDPRIDLTGVREAISAYHAGKLADGDAAARTIRDPMARIAADWVALRLFPRETGFNRVTAFLDAHPAWPSAGWGRRRAEEAIFADKSAMSKAQAWFAQHTPETAYGKLAQAKLLIAADRNPDANAIIRDLWRTDDCAGNLEAAILKQFGDRLTPADHKARADRLLYKNNSAAGLRAATLAGPDVLALARIRIAMNNETATDKMLATIPASLKDDPAALFARIQMARRSNKIAEAAALMLAAPRDWSAIVDPDEWWVERRLIARKLLDAGDAKTALRIAQDASPASHENHIEAAFHAGWIALRFLNDTATATREFDRLASYAETPMSRARAAYWQGRTAEASGAGERALGLYESAAAQTSTFYGQMARTRLGKGTPPIRRALSIARGDDRVEVIRVIELLMALDEREIAFSLAMDCAKTLSEDRQIAALAALMQTAQDARATLAIGKVASQRGFALDDAAFPIFGIPAYTPLSNSAGREIVYAIARQESSFQTKAVSGAGARGLMQMIVSTAQRTAQRAKVAFSADRLTTDPAFNAQLGAAHLGDLLQEQGGSHILTFAAYNAGGKRVKEWMSAYGDPRQPGVDAIDWIERIPITETRNYVQRVLENVEMYKERFAEDANGGIAAKTATATGSTAPAAATVAQAQPSKAPEKPRPLPVESPM